MEESTAPPYTNRGVQNTEQPILTASVDWFQATFQHYTFDSVVEDYLHLKSKFFKPSDVKFFGYNFSWVFNNIYVMCNKDFEHYHVLMSGSACKAFEFYLQGDNYNWELFFKDLFIDEDNELKKQMKIQEDKKKINPDYRFEKIIVDKKIKLTRLDICLDDRKLFLDIPTLWRKIKRGECVSKFKLGRSIESVTLKDGVGKGQTIYFGSDSSAVKFRFYQKNYEQAYKRNVDVEEIGDWNRYECQMRNEQATNAARKISESGNVEFVIKGIMLNYIRFLVETKYWKGVNKSRQEIYKPYYKMLEGAEKLKITLSPEVKTIDDKREWARNQLSTTFALIEIANELALEYDLKSDKSYYQDILSNSKLDDNGKNLIFSHILHLLEKKEGKKIKGDKLHALHKSLSTSINKKYGDMK